jgi:hypothetical protein
VETGEWKQGSGDREQRPGVETERRDRMWRQGIGDREWRNLHNVELHDFYCSLDVIRVMKADEMGGACSRCGGEERRIENFSEKYS